MRLLYKVLSVESLRLSHVEALCRASSTCRWAGGPSSGDSSLAHPLLSAADDNAAAGACEELAESTDYRAVRRVALRYLEMLRQVVQPLVGACTSHAAGTRHSSVRRELRHLEYWRLLRGRGRAFLAPRQLPFTFTLFTAPSPTNNTGRILIGTTKPP
jgi:hypothetical protein